MKNRNFCIFAAAVQSFYKKRSPETIDFRAPFPQSDLPYQELLGNYNKFGCNSFDKDDLPYQELLGNYNREVINWYNDPGFTIPRTARELQPKEQ